MAHKKSNWSVVYKDDMMEIRVNPVKKRVSVVFVGANARLDDVRHARGKRGPKQVYSWFQMTKEA